MCSSLNEHYCSFDRGGGLLESALADVPTEWCLKGVTVESRQMNCWTGILFWDTVNFKNSKYLAKDAQFASKSY